MKLLLRMRVQTSELRDHLRYCCPLEPVLRGIREKLRSDDGSVVGVGTIRRLEEAGVRSVRDLAPLGLADLIGLGVRRDFAEQILPFAQRNSRSQIPEIDRTPGLGFRALLTENGASSVELTRV
jgi:helicase